MLGNYSNTYVATPHDAAVASVLMAYLQQQQAAVLPQLGILVACHYVAHTWHQAWCVAVAQDAFRSIHSSL
jgi:hypothetical protein